jgi:hypothetical protein
VALIFFEKKHGLLAGAEVAHSYRASTGQTSSQDPVDVQIAEHVIHGAAV